MTDVIHETEVFTIPGIDLEASVPCRWKDANTDHTPCNAEATRALGLQHGGFPCDRPHHLTLCNAHAEVVRFAFSTEWGRAGTKRCCYCGSPIPTVAHLIIYDRGL